MKRFILAALLVAFAAPGAEAGCRLFKGRIRKTAVKTAAVPVKVVSGSVKAVGSCVGGVCKP